MRARLCLFAILAAAPLAAAQFEPSFNLEARGGYASADGGANSGLGLGQFQLVPALGLDGWGELIPVLSGGLNGQEQAVDENTLFLRSADLNASLEWAAPFAGSRLPIRAEALRSWSIRSLGEGWGSGLYDWEQYGGALGWRSKFRGASWGLEGRLGHRSYPNFHDPAAALSAGKNYYLKDYDLAAATLNYVDQPAAGWTVAASYGEEWRDYTDSYVVREDGQLDLARRQRDQVHNLCLSVARVPEGSAWGLDAEIQVLSLESNQNSFDLSANHFVREAGAFDLERLSLGLHADAQDWVAGLKASLSCGDQNRNTRRPLRNEDGAYTLGLQSDLELDASLELSYELPWSPRLVGGASARRQTSNQRLSPGERPEYSLVVGSAGLAWSWPTP